MKTSLNLVSGQELHAIRTFIDSSYRIHFDCCENARKRHHFDNNKNHRHTCPLYVHQLVFIYGQLVWYKIVLHCRICLYDIAAFTSDIEVVNGVRVLNIVLVSTWTRFQLKHMGPVLEGTTILGGVYCHSERSLSCANIYQLILLNWRNH